MVLRFMKSEGVSDARLLGRASRLMDEGHKARRLRDEHPRL